MNNEQPQIEIDENFTATYSPEDDKLRFYTLVWLDDDLFERIKKAGFRWARIQELFFATWTPARENLMNELCGAIGDEDTSLVDRAEQRADRFGGYQSNRARDAENAHKAVSALSDNIPLGQPILVGHHSEKRARKEAEKIKRGMRKAVDMWRTSEYWETRVKGVIRHAKYKDKPGVRARRIKTLEAEKRKFTRDIDNSGKFLRAWFSNPMTQEKALYIANRDYISMCFLQTEYPKSTYEGVQSIWSALDDEIITPEQAQLIAIKTHNRTIESCTRWVEHTDLRLTYEKAILVEQGNSDLLKPEPRAKQLPLLNYRAADGISVEEIYSRGNFKIYPQIEMTKEEYSKYWHEYKGTVKIEKSHRVRILIKKFDRFVVFLTDGKVHKKPEPVTSNPVEHEFVITPRPTYTPKTPNKFDTMSKQLKEGIKVVSAPQLFPTPNDIVSRMKTEANIQQSDRILEPSAGTGSIVGGIESISYPAGEMIAVEINYELATNLQANYPLTRVIQADFLECEPQNLDGTAISLGKFDKILMNPPFANGADIKHIKHALKFLKSGGRLVAICANSTRQKSALMPLVEESGGTWEALPHGAFTVSGTEVSTVLLVIEG